MVNRKKTNRWLIHSLFWFLNFAIFIAINASCGQSLTREWLLSTAIRYLLLIGVTYINLYFLIPNYLLKNRYILYPFLLIGDILLFTFIQSVIQILFYGYILHSKDDYSISDAAISNVILICLYLLITSTIKFTADWSRQKKLATQIQMQNLQTELQLLKTQINPHFLFNSINTIYGYIDKRNSTARNVLLKFSEILRYQLYECSAEVIDIQKEIKYICNYIELQKARTEHTNICISMPDNLPDIKIAPLLFIPFIENTFKHVGINEQQENYIKIEIKAEQNRFILKTANSKNPCLKNANNKPGIGLVNVKRRLELIYPEKHRLLLHDYSNLYEVSLSIQI